MELGDKLGGVGDDVVRRGGPVADDVHGLVPQLVVDVVQHDLEAARVAVVVHGQDEDEAVGGGHGCREAADHVAVVLVDVVRVCQGVDFERWEGVDGLGKQVVRLEGRVLLHGDVCVGIGGGKEFLEHAADALARAGRPR